MNSIPEIPPPPPPGSVLRTLQQRRASRWQQRLEQERQHLQSLPARRFIDYTELTVAVTSSSTISVKRGLYSVPSRLIAERLRVHLYYDQWKRNDSHNDGEVSTHG